MGYNFMWIKYTGMLFSIGLYTLQAGATGCCTEGFHSLQQLMSATDTLSAPDRPIQGLHPRFRITCGGNLTEIIYTTTSRGSSGSEYFIVWRETSPGTDVYYAVSPIISRGIETFLAPINKKTALYSVRVSNFSVSARDFIGFVAFVPSTLRFLNHYNSVGSIYKFSSFSGKIDLKNETSYNRRASPLITAVIAPSSVACSNTQILPIPTRSITPSIISPTNPTPVASPAIFTVAFSPTPNSIGPTTLPTLSNNSQTVLIATAAIVSSGITFCLTLLLFSIIVMCVVRDRKDKKRFKLGQSSSTEHTLSDICPEAVSSADKNFAKLSTVGSGNSDGDNCSMESNPIYGNHCNGGHIQQDKSIRDENNYHTLEFEERPAVREWKQQHAINGDSNYYHTLQHLDHKPKYDSESEYCYLATTSNYINAAVMQNQEGRGDDCDVNTLELAHVKSGRNAAEIENEYDKPNAYHNHVEHSSDIVLKPNISYDSLNM